MQDYNDVPEKLKAMKQWVCFKLEWNEKKGKCDKVPYDPRTGYRAKANDPATWEDYATATNAVERGVYDGIGFEFANGVFGVDLDRVIEDGKLTAEARDIIKTLDSYTEYSPSGTGAHILCMGTIPDKDRRNGNVEMYADGRFFTVTGKVLGRPKDIAERTTQAAVVHAKYLRREEKRQPQQARRDMNMNDNDLIAMARKSANGARFTALWNGDISAYGGDHSRADQALINDLAYWTNGDAYRMDALFRQSGLMRPKWNERRGESTYGNITIGKALENFTPYAPRASAEEDFRRIAKRETPNIASQEPRPDAMNRYLENNFIRDVERFKGFKDRKTGFANLDRNCGGLYPGLYVIGAISSLGKTTFTHQLSDQLAGMGDHVLFFSLEQNRLEMVTKSLSRLTAQRDKSTAVSAINIRGGKLTSEVIAAAEEYKKIADRVSVIECNFDANINFVLDYTRRYMAANPGIKPVVAVDYLQIIPPTDPRQSDKEKVDSIIRGLKKLQSDNDLVIFVVSSINRANYLSPIDFESFKESGGIEYTADVVWGLQLQILNDDLFNGEKKIKEKREKVREAKKANPRKIELLCLKNRYGVSSYSCGFIYTPKFDLFEIDDEYEYSELFDAEPAKRL
jgi:replicative DNA helicase